MSTNAIIRELEEQRNFALARAAKYAGQLEDALLAIDAKDKRILELEAGPADRPTSDFTPPVDDPHDEMGGLHQEQLPAEHP